MKCGNKALTIAVAANAVIKLYRLVLRLEELYQEILTFSISHDRRAVRIYGHYVLIDGKGTSFYRHLLRDFSITDQEGKDKWTTYKFVRNDYGEFYPIHHKRICSAIDQLPNPEDFDLEYSSQQLDLGLFQ